MSDQNNTSIEKRLAKYGAMSLAVASGVLATPNAHAGLVFIDTTGWANNSTTAGTVYFNPAAGAFGNASTALFKMSHVGAVSSSGSRVGVFGLSSAAGVAVSAGGFIRQLPTSSIAVLGGASFLGLGPIERSDGSNNHFGNWAAPDFGYVGLVMAGNHYGWARIQVQANYHAQLLGFAYNDDSEDPIPSGIAPEPSSLLLLAMGGAGIAAYRRRKNADVAK